MKFNTLRGLAAEGVKELKKAGLESPGLDTELLLAKVLNKDRHFLHMHPDYRLDDKRAARYYRLLQQRAGGQPLQYLTGFQEFMGLKFAITPSVLVPRPDTEILTEAVLNRLKQRRTSDKRGKDSSFRLPRGQRGPVCDTKDVNKSGALNKGGALNKCGALNKGGAVGYNTIKGLELGTGSGAIAVSLAYYFPGLFLKAVDISFEILETAKNNALEHGVADRIEFIKGDLFSPFKGTNIRFDFVVSNPPYISAEEMKELPREVLNEPKEALYGGNDGLHFYKRISAGAPIFLKAGGFLALEIGHNRADGVMKILEGTGVFDNMEVMRDLSGKNRVILADVVCM